MCQIKLDFVQNSEEADYVLKNDNVFPGATNKNVACGQNEVISYATEVVETLRYPNLSLHNDEVMYTRISERIRCEQSAIFYQKTDFTSKNGGFFLQKLPIQLQKLHGFSLQKERIFVGYTDMVDESLSKNFTHIPF